MIFQDVQSMDEQKSWQSTFQYLNLKSRENAGSQKTGKSAANRGYNRYRDVVPYDHSLVLLRNSDTTYINANLIEVSSIGKKYILTQGPLASTCEHFWEMVWEQNTYSIVMLNRVVEKNQLKCHQYWPLDGCMEMKNINVTLLDEEDHREFVIRILKLEHLQEKITKTVQHFHFVAWPDFGVPVSPQAFLKYLFAVQEYQSSIKGIGPPVIHCSAGIGRSGTFALIDAALTEIKQTNNMMDYDVKKVLLEMRSYRAGLIQTTEQLRFSYIAILEGANMVAPEAYGTAYWKMASQEDSGNEESEEEVQDLHGKRAAGSESEVNEEPKAKEPRKELPPTELSESESGEEDEIVNLSDIDNDNENADDEGGEIEEEPNVPTPLQRCDQILGFRENSLSQKGLRTPEQERKEEILAESDTDKGGTNKGKGKENNKTELNECLVSERETKTTTSATNDSPTNANIDAENSRHQQLKAYEAVKHVGPGKTSDVPGEKQEKVQALIKAFNSDEVFGNNGVEKVVGRWQSSEAGSSESLGGEDDEAGHKPQPKRSAMRTSSSEGKRKYVSFSQKNGEGEKEVDEGSTWMNYNPIDSMNELETESSVLRKRQVEERKQKLSDKVDKIKKKMKDGEGSNSFLGKTVIAGLVICAVMAGVAFFYYRYQS